MSYTFRDYCTILRLLEDYSRELQEATASVQKQFDEACRRDFKAAFPRRRWTGNCSKAPNYEAISAQFHAAVWTIADEECTPYRNWLETLRDSIGAVVEPERTEELRRVFRVYAGAYMSQGWSQRKYQYGDAENVALRITHYGFRAEVREPEGPDGQYEVWANITEDGWSLLDRRPGLSLRDWVASCWRRGLNPRVLNPFLPAGIEEKLGVDYFGNVKEGVA